MDDHKIVKSTVAAVLFFLLAATEALSVPGEVLCHQKISSTEGGFEGDLDVEDYFGRSVASIGDLNGDGVGDVAVGASWDDDGGLNYGAVWILFLNIDGTVASHQKISATEGGFPSGGLSWWDEFGRSVTSLGDLDGDGVVDLAVGAVLDDDGGATQTSNRGAVWVLFLNADGTVKSAQKISDTQGGFTGVLNDIDWFGGSVAGLGDLNGDGVEDVAVGAPYDDDGCGAVDCHSGAVWILFLNADGTVASHQKISPTAGNFPSPLDTQDWFGWSVASLGDLDGDGVVDLAVGAVGDDDGSASPIANRGAVWVLFLNTDGTVKSAQKISDTQGNFTGILDDIDWFGGGLSGVGDINGDDVVDVAVGAPYDDDGCVNCHRGAVWLLFLNTDGTVASYQKISPTAGNFTGVLDMQDWFGWSVAALGDHNNDGTTDLAVGAPRDDDGTGTDAGAVWVLFLGDTSTGDCNDNGIPDQCEADCDGDGAPDECEIIDCMGDPACDDCNGNIIPDGCDIADGTSLDCQPDGIPDECQASGDVQSTWVGGAGLWSVAANWCPTLIPDNIAGIMFDVTVDGMGQEVTLDRSATLDGLSLMNGAIIEMSDNSGADFRSLAVGGSLTNSGIFRATDRERMLLDAPTIDQSSGGSLQATDGDFNDPTNPDVPGEKSVLQVSGAQVIGGSAQTEGANSEIQLIGGAELNGVSIEGVVVPDGQPASFTGTITNNGPLLIAPDGAESSSLAPTSGGGTLLGQDGIDDGVRLGGETVAILGLDNASFVNSANHRIEGAGIIRGGFDNQGTIQADVLDQALIVLPLGAKVNDGLMQAVNGGTLRLQDDVTGSGSLVAHDGTIEVSSFTFQADEVVLDIEGTYRKDPGVGNATAALIAGTITLHGAPIDADPGLMWLKDSMSVTTSGDFTLDAREPLHLRGDDTPPDLVCPGVEHMSIGGDFRILGGPGSLDYSAPTGMSLSGNFVNESTDAAIFNWGGGGLRMEGTVLQTIEAAGENLGPVPAGLIDNFAIAVLELASDTTVQIVDGFDNQEDGSAECDEALYVDALIVNAGATLLTEGCVVYYGELTLAGSIPALGTYVLQICPADIDADGVVNSADLALLLGSWGPCTECTADLDDDGDVDSADLALLLGTWGACL